MMNCASKLLKDDGFLLIYGPFQHEGKFSTDSNKEFHDTLSSIGVSEWGLKDVADLKKAANDHGMELKEIIDMPSNNFSLIFGHK
jgi:muconolactone delta-isomerase